MKNRSELNPVKKIIKRDFKKDILLLILALLMLADPFEIPKWMGLPIIIAILYFAITFFTNMGGEKKDKEMMLTNRDEVKKLEEVTSYPVTTNQSSGYTFSKLGELQDFSKPKGVYVDHFAYYNEMEEFADPGMLKKAKNIKINIDKLDFTKTLMVLGGMGSGKTEFYHSILNQKAFNRSIVHDVKGDFVQKWYNEETDYIFNPYDERGFVWDIWAEMDENEALIESFVNNLMQSQTDEKDFFTGSARKVIIEMFMQVHFMLQDSTPEQKWAELNKRIREYGEQASDDKTKSSVYATMELIIDLFEFFEYQSGLENVKQFSFKEYLSGNGTLYLLNNPSVSKKLNPLFTSFVALLIEKLLSRADTKEDLTLILLDEYLSLNFDKETRLKLLTQIRSKGGCLMLGMQYLPKKDKEHEQLLDSSCYGTIIFKLNDNETVKHIVESMGDMEYIAVSEGKKLEYTKSAKSKKFLTSEHLQSMPQYTHLSIFAGDSKIYLGYTELVKIYPRYENFIKANMKDFYEFKYNKTAKSDTKDIQEAIQHKESDNDEELAQSFDTIEEGFEIDENGIQYDPIKTQERRDAFTPEQRKEIIETWLDLDTEGQVELAKEFDLENVSLQIFLGDEDEES
jgi:hypothetical protein